MNTLQHAWQRARRRRALTTLLLGLPWALAATVLALRLAGFDIACVAGTVSLLACAALATARARQLDPQWLQRQLDGSGASEDSPCCSSQSPSLPEDCTHACSWTSAS